MTERLEFQEFKKSLEEFMLPMDILADCVQFDPDSPIPKLKLKPDAPLDNHAPEYDVDSAIYKYSREMQKKRRDHTQKKSSESQKSIVAEGDSWFHLPDYSLFWSRIFPHAIVDRIEKNGNFVVTNIAHWGHTIKDILNTKEYLSVINAKDPDYFLLSAGGNDLQEGIANQKQCFVHSYDINRERDDYLTKAGLTGIAEIGKGYKTILDEVTKKFPGLIVFCHGYDYPRIQQPDESNDDELNPNEAEDKNRWIGLYLEHLGIPYKMMDAILKPIVDFLNLTIETTVIPYRPWIKFIDLRGVASKQEFDWMDDMHPDEDGFMALAKKFEEAMRNSLTTGRSYS